MKTFTITHSPIFRREGFLDHAYRVVSRSGLHTVESKLIETFHSLPPISSALFIGGRTGASAMILEDLMPDAIITVHAYDIHHADTIYRNLLTNNFSPQPLVDDNLELQGAFIRRRSSSFSRLRVACTASFPKPPEGLPYTHVFMLLSDGAMSVELSIAQLEELSCVLEPGCKLTLIGEDIRESFLKQIKARFTRINFVDKRGLGYVSALAQTKSTKEKTFVAQFDVSTPGHDPVTLTTIPGVFCHRRPDNGGLALSEEAVAVLDPNKAYSVIDMGCGCGMDGILLAKALPNINVTYLDSNSLALRSTARNLEALDLTARLVLSSTGFKETSSADIFLANPPYFSDYRIAELFIQTAMAALKPGGQLFFVARNITRPREIIKEVGFRDLSISYRRGYGVVKAYK